MGKNIDRFVARLRHPTKGQVRTELARAAVEGEEHTPIRRVLPGEEPKRGDYKCQGKTWSLDHIKSGLIQMCPQENLQYISYHLPFDSVMRYCPRCAEYMIAHPEDKYLQKLDIPPEVPKLGWRPNPMPKGWKP